MATVNPLESYAISTTPYNSDDVFGYYGGGGAVRGFGRKFNEAQVAREDWQRNEQAADNAFYRNLALQDDSQAWSADEAQKARDFEERMSNTSYQRMVNDLKQAGLNPVLAYSNGGASTPTASAPSAGSSSSSGGYSRSDRASADHYLGTLLQFAGGLVDSADRYEHEHNKVMGFTEGTNKDKSDMFGKVLLGALKAFVMK